MKRYKEIEHHKIEEAPLPSRKIKHPSEKNKWTQYFYSSLVILFVLLTAGLLLWGLYFQ